MSILIDLARLFAGFFFQIFPFAYLCLLPFKGSMRLTHPRAVTCAVIILMATIFSIGGTIAKQFNGNSPATFNISNSLFMILFFLCIVYYCFLIKESAAKKILIICFVAIFAFFISLITSMLWYYYGLNTFESGYVDADPYSVGYTIFLFIFTAAVFPFAYVITQKYMIPMLDILEDTDIKYMSILSVLLLLLLSTGFATIKKDIIETSVSAFICTTLCLAVGSVYTVCFIFLRKLKEEQKFRIDLLKSEHINNIAQEQYKHICDSIESQRHMRHNFRQQLITLRGLYEEQPEKIQEYLADYLKQIPEYTLMPICADPVVNSIISYYKSTSESDGFIFKCSVDLPPIMNISDTDLVTILGNLLENALAAGRLIQKDNRQIVLHIGYSHKMLGITVDNTFNGMLKKKNGKFLSTKHDHAALGLQSIKNIAERYNGSASFDSKDGIFYSSVMLANIPPQNSI